MHEFTTMYHYFKGVSDSAPNKVIVDLKSEMSRKTSTVSQAVLSVPQSPTLLPVGGEGGGPRKQPEYMEMHCNSSSSESDPYGPVNGVTNLNYINVEGCSPDASVDVCDGVPTSAQFSEAATTNELQINEPAYYESKDSNKTDPFSEDCSNLLDNATVTPPQTLKLSQMTERQLQQRQQELMADYLIQPSNRPVTAVEEGFGDYLTHPSNKPLLLDANTSSASSAYMNDEVEGSHMKMSFGASSKKKAAQEAIDQMNTSASSGRANTLKRQESETSKASVDDELLEIINDFKNNVFTINEVEQLVSTWKNRNDVQQSFKDKEQQLQKMRHEYDRLQTQMKDRMKRPTPFERVRRIFSRSKSEEKEGLGDVSQEKFNTSGHRPPSSLSLHSVTSSSSGRMSTGSVCSGTSLGDSGTHSDHDERRPATTAGGNSSSNNNYPGTNCRVGTPGSLLMDNYMVPPAPRPVSTPTEERFAGASEHYIIFPSNAPVFQHDYINFGGGSVGASGGGLNTIDENKEADIHTIQIQKPKDVVYAPVTRKVNLCSSFRRQGNGGGAEGAGDEEVMMRNQMQSSRKEIKDRKMFARQHSSEANNEQVEDHSYMNLSV